MFSFYTVYLTEIPPYFRLSLFSSPSSPWLSLNRYQDQELMAKPKVQSDQPMLQLARLVISKLPIPSMEDMDTDTQDSTEVTVDTDTQASMAVTVDTMAAMDTVILSTVRFQDAPDYHS